MATKKTADPASGAKKSAAKKTTQKTAKKTAEKTTTAKKATRRTTASSDGSPRRSGAPRAEARKKVTAAQVAARGAQQLLELTGRDAEGVTGLERTDDGWKVCVEVVEVRRIPDTTDVLALYEVEVDEDGDLTGYHRLRRYNRGNPREE